ncbi:NAD(P)H-dependent oxidoreductase [Granulicoccus sp. GXG6511]|uniref:NAD(P)H-dependent oxidoreductase n=1 Tax=Granulicoccus sp. GXG6511 TaxID=3381351 RepID=UPI003D7D5CAE
MIITDTLLQQRHKDGNPVRLGVIGPGFMARGMMNHIRNTMTGMVVAAVYARKPEQARESLAYAGYAPNEIVDCDSTRAIDKAIAAGSVAVTGSYADLTAADGIDAVIDCSGSVEFGAHVALSTIDNGKHLVLMNAEVDATLGSILSRKAESAGIVYTGIDGDQPGVEMNLIRFVRGLGVTPLLAGNIKGLQDRFRNPTTQEGFAKQWGQNVHMVTSFADGTKVSIEQALVANAAGLSVHENGCLGRDFEGHVDELTSQYDVDELRAMGGAVDYVVKAKPGPGVFVLGTHDDPKQQHFLSYYKLGQGPLYSFYTPYHLCHFEVPTTIARAVLLGDATIRPLPDGPRVEVVTVAKKDLKAGETLDGIGGYAYYGECRPAARQRAENMLPVGLATGAVVNRDIAVDEVISYADVTLPSDQLSVQLRAEQDAMFGGAI